ncbi:DUF3500 domain-containing protein [Luteitalea pratensis]|uniref:DUF3500 domain-containing protein n=1 Tax=Luteitalea pratensis TaxID=1855912 RepID=UPI0014725344|nr:DUF3500 domain-containing protein [Luteitalea pratensis]
MRLVLGLGSAALLGVFVSAGARVPTQPAAVTPSASAPAAATTRIVAAAQQFVSTLDQAGRGKVQFPFDSGQKTHWSNFPSASSNGRACGSATSRRRNGRRR